MKLKYHVLLTVIIVAGVIALRVMHHRRPRGLENWNQVCTAEVLDSLRGLPGEGVFLITFLKEDCNFCGALLQSKEYRALQIPKCVFNWDLHPNNKFLGQSLHCLGFPSSYVVNRELTVLGVVNGAFQFKERVSSVVEMPGVYCSVHFTAVPQQRVLPILSESLKSLYCYWTGDVVGMENHARESLSHSPCFFNHYMIYLSYKQYGKPDSCNYHGRQALAFTNDASQFIYDDLIGEVRSNTTESN